MRINALPEMLLVCTIVLLVNSCSLFTDNRIENRIVAEIEAKCSEGDSCVLHLDSLTGFKWDKMYAFGYYVNENEIDSIIGVPYGYSIEFTRKIIFMNKDTIVHREEHNSDIENITDGEVIFNPGSEARYFSCTNDSCSFYAKIEHYNHHFFYSLRPVK